MRLEELKGNPAGSIHGSGLSDLVGNLGCVMYPFVKTRKSIFLRQNSPSYKKR